MIKLPSYMQLMIRIDAMVEKEKEKKRCDGLFDAVVGSVLPD